MQKIAQKNEDLLESLQSYEKHLKDVSGKFFKNQLETILLFKTFLDQEENVFERTNSYGHFTASGFVLSQDGSKLLMTHHRKLNKWFQLGGHADGHPVLHEVAYKECEEESGLLSLQFFNYNFYKLKTPLIFDLDCHLIPARKQEKEHFHYDVRYLLTASDLEVFKVTEESLDLKWIPLSEIKDYNRELSITRCVQKAEWLLKK